jgi:Protein of unknown function (DUF2799)
LMPTTFETASGAMRLATVTALVIWGVSACSTFSKVDCERAEWLKLGQRDGNLGRPGSWRTACPHLSLTEEESYRAGYEQGLSNYCTPTHAYYVGRRGEPFPRVCPEDRQMSVAREYRDGLDYRSRHLR